MKVAIVHDWLYGGSAERVVYELHKIFPDADIYTSYCSDEWREKLSGKVKTGYLQRWPFSKLRKFLPVLRMRWFRGLDLSSYDLVISSTGNGEAKHISASKNTTHICYCHTPVHYYWRHYDLYLKNPGFGVLDPIARLGLRLLVSPLRKKDYAAAQNPDYFIANSHHIQKDIKTYYNKYSEVIYPPVDTGRFISTKGPEERSGFIAVGRQVPHKKTDIIVSACSELNLPLKVIGTGPEHSNLKKIAGPSVKFLSNVSDDEMPLHMAGAESLIFASYDDFGITPIEAMACGTPVIAYKAGGALDYVIPGKTGEFYNSQDVESLVEALSQFDSSKYSYGDIKKHSEQFSNGVFDESIVKFIKDVIR